MARKLIIKNILLGLLSWLIPFVVSLLFYNQSGELTIQYATFKSIILIVGIISGCYLLFRYFKFVDHNYITNGIIVGLSWFVINIILDSIILIPMMKSTFSSYFMSIGMGYISIPVISVAIGYILDKKVQIVTKI